MCGDCSRKDKNKYFTTKIYDVMLGGYKRVGFSVLVKTLKNQPDKERIKDDMIFLVLATEFVSQIKLKKKKFNLKWNM